MTLNTYKKKRDFSVSKEPQAKLKKAGKASTLQFVVQKHAATRLHYDFRLELNGVLKSWAVPKGPSLNPAEKRLAIMVEDHPYDYRTFEGTIPKGSYGAGTVMVWDSGVYAPLDEKHQLADEKSAEASLKKGLFSFILYGKKLKGIFTLIKLKKDPADNHWILIKGKDEYVESQEVTKKDRSAITDRTLDEIAEGKKIIRKKRGKVDQVPPEKVPLTHLDKLFWPKEGYTKGDLIKYYDEIAAYLLPYLLDRPESLRRFPNGIDKPGFFHKNMTQIPAWLPTIEVQHEEKKVNYLLIQDKKSLLYAVNLGCIDLNPLSSRTSSLYKPDYMVIDLDPEDIDFEAVVETARVVHAILDQLDVPNYCKTSGGRGIHIYVPMGAKYTYEQVKEFAHLIALMALERLPSVASLERSPSKRQKRVYLDYLQNNFGQTLVAPYCVRAKPGAPVSTPLEWHEVKKGLSPLDFTIENMSKRLKKKGDIFKPVLGKGIDLKRVLKQIKG